MDTELITAQEFDWIVNNEPTFRIEGQSFIGKVGRTNNGRDIQLKITLPPEFYPVVKPEVRVLNNIQHPNINADQTLALQLLEDWEPRYRIKDIIIAARRLFLKSKNMIKETPVQTSQPVQSSGAVNQLRSEVMTLQAELSDYSQRINQLKAKKLDDAGVKSNLSGSIPISRQQELEATRKALIDLLGLIEFKFEDASMDEIEFFRLYRKYIREQYLVNKQITNGGDTNVIPKQKTKEAIRN